MLSVADVILKAADNFIQLTKMTGISLGVGSPPWPEAAHKETAAQTHQRHFFSSAPLICRVRRLSDPQASVSCIRSGPPKYRVCRATGSH